MSKVMIEMEMPKSCSDCPLAYFDSYYKILRCPFNKANDFISNYTDSRSVDCPLKEAK